MLKKFLLPPFCARLSFLSFLLFLFKAPLALYAQSPVASIDGHSGFTAKLINIEASTNETFRYNASLHNGSAKPVIYEFKTILPAGWMISYKIDGNQVTSINMAAGSIRDLSIEVNATPNTTPGKYPVPVKAIADKDTLALNLEAAVKGSYGMTLTTPSGKLSEELTSGGHKEIHLEIKNSGTLPLKDIELSSQLPTNWEASFEPSKVTQLEPGKTQTITANLKVPDKTIAGDYAATFTATNSNGNSQAAFRMVVTTSWISGWIGVMIILLAVSMVYYLIRKYGRR